MPDKQASQEQEPSSELVARVTSAFLIMDASAVIGPLESIADRLGARGEYVRDAADGLGSVISAATLPFQLACDAVQQRRSDRFLSAERIRSLKHIAPGSAPTEELQRHSVEIARSNMASFLASTTGADFIRDAVVAELHRSLASRVVAHAAKELMNQAVVSTWAVFEHFASQFIIDRINVDPHLAKHVLSASELKAFFGKQVVDIEAIDEHGYDLTRSMGSVIFRGKRLDNVAVLRSVLSAIFDKTEMRKALGTELWILNQRRHLLVHKRGLIDREYLERTGDIVETGKRLTIVSGDVESYMMAVQRAIAAMATAAHGDL